MKTALLTDWLTIGTAGATVDGRVISDKKLIEAAETYDPDEYTAVINAEHLYGNYGSVRELQTSKDKKGRTILQARIRPNKYYLQQNSEDYRLFFSMELQPNFAKSGKYYLVGLASTDKPNSLGTSELHFSREDGEIERGDPVEINLSSFAIDNDQDPEKHKNLINAIADKVKEVFTNNNNKQEEDGEMTPEQFKQLTEGQDKVVEAVNGLATTLKEKFTTETPEGGDGNDAGDNGGNNGVENNNQEETVSREEFSKLAEGQTSLLEAVNGLTTTLKDALNEKHGKDVPAGEGAANDKPKFI